MKQKLLLISLAAIALASCSKDETMSTNTGHAIDFRPAMQTRATETTTANLANFYVTAIDEAGKNYFTDVNYERADDYFTSTPAYYWPNDGSTLSFFAYAPSASDLGGTLAIENNMKTLANFAPAAAISDQKDFITAKNTGNKEQNESTGVALDFKHQLAQIEVKAKNANEGYIYKVQGVRIGQPISTGTFNFEDSSWALGADKKNYEVTYSGSEKTLAAEAVSIMEAVDNNAMLIPQQLTAWKSSSDKTNAEKGAYLAVKVQIETKSGSRVYPAVGEYDWVAVPIDTKWEAGQKYIYTLDFSNGAGVVDPEKPEPDPEDPFNPGEDILGDAIKFTVVVTDWQENSQPDVEM